MKGRLDTVFHQNLDLLISCLPCVLNTAKFNITWKHLGTSVLFLSFPTAPSNVHWRLNLTDLFEIGTKLKSFISIHLFIPVVMGLISMNQGCFCISRALTCYLLCWLQCSTNGRCGQCLPGQIPSLAVVEWDHTFPVLFFQGKWLGCLGAYLETWNSFLPFLVTWCSECNLPGTWGHPQHQQAFLESSG